MIKVDLDKIITQQALEAHLNDILYQVEEQERLFVVTKKGRPRAALVNVDYLEELTGRSAAEAEEYEGYDKFDRPAETGQPIGMAKSEVSPPTPAKPDEVKPVANNSEPEPKKPEPVEPELAEGELPELDIDDIEFDSEPEETAVVEPPAAEPPTTEPIESAIPSDASLTDILTPAEPPSPSIQMPVPPATLDEIARASSTPPTPRP